MSYRITKGTWSGGLRPEYCCHCGRKNCHTHQTPGDPLGYDSGLLCPDCWDAIGLYCKDGSKKADIAT